MNLSGEEFRLLWNLWSNYSKLKHSGINGWSNRTRVSISLCNSLNPLKSVDKFRNFLFDEGIIVFSKDGLMTLDEDKFLSLMRSNPTYCAVKAFIHDEDSTIFVE